MSATRTYDTIVLRTYDVGEADRFCILFTRERGRIAARARGVRRTKSRMGGSLLPFRRVQADLHEGQSGFLITGAHGASALLPTDHTNAVGAAQRGTELLQRLLEDDEPLPEIFDMTDVFLRECTHESAPVLAFTVRLLAVLGVFPLSPKELKMEPEATNFLQTCTGPGTWWNAPLPAEQCRRNIERFCGELLRVQNPSMPSMLQYMPELVRV
jgi:recombinational DNA repair protein (RecF pathway)